jgi:hypothetical protein
MNAYELVARIRGGQVAHAVSDPEKDLVWRYYIRQRTFPNADDELGEFDVLHLNKHGAFISRHYRDAEGVAQIFEAFLKDGRNGSVEFGDRDLWPEKRADWDDSR